MAQPNHRDLQILYLNQGNSGSLCRIQGPSAEQAVVAKIVELSDQTRSNEPVELHILSMMSHPNIVRPLHDFVFTTAVGVPTARVILLEAMKSDGADLIEKLHKRCKDPGTRVHVVKTVAAQVLLALQYLKSRSIHHRDVKHGNFLADIGRHGQIHVKLADFDQALMPGATHAEGEPLESEGGTNGYRSWERVLGSVNYSHNADLWSLGIVIIEMLNGSLLLPNEDDPQLEVEGLLEVFGGLSPEQLKGLENCPRFEEMEPLLSSYEHPAVPMKCLAPSIDDQGADFLARCLDPNPHTRMDIDDAVKHVWIRNTVAYFAKESLDRRYLGPSPNQKAFCQCVQMCLEERYRLLGGICGLSSMEFFKARLPGEVATEMEATEAQLRPDTPQEQLPAPAMGKLLPAVAQPCKAPPPQPPPSLDYVSPPPYNVTRATGKIQLPPTASRHLVCKDSKGKGSQFMLAPIFAAGGSHVSLDSASSRHLARGRLARDFPPCEPQYPAPRGLWQKVRDTFARQQLV